MLLADGMNGAAQGVRHRLQATMREEQLQNLSLTRAEFNHGITLSGAVDGIVDFSYQSIVPRLRNPDSGATI